MSDNTQEEFCGACVAVPAAMAGAGVAGVASKNGSGSHKKVKKIVFWVSIVFTVLSLAVAAWWYTRCTTCR